MGMVKTLSHDGAFLAGGQFCCRLLVQYYFMHNTSFRARSSPNRQAGLEFRHTICIRYGVKINLVARGISSPPLLNKYDEEWITVIQNMLDLVAELNNTPSRSHQFCVLIVNYHWGSIVLNKRRRTQESCLHR
ncbi:hypothetical protein EDB19DRAFT_1698671 [Suillus lakei]|nr:hypothetical protein EDB19DRAFT_1698671 [Suillus lakei]